VGVGVGVREKFGKEKFGTVLVLFKEKVGLAFESDASLLGLNKSLD